MISIQNRRELLVDDYLIDSARTDAPLVMHHPERREKVLVTDAPWEGDGWAFYTAFRDGDRYRMYYIASQMFNSARTAHKPPFQHICYAESGDGVNWVKPDLGLVSFRGNKHNNILLTQLSGDGVDVFIDKNPACPPDEKYKLICVKWGHDTNPERWYRQLWCLSGSDGVSFPKERMILDHGRLDSQNIAFYDENLGKYVCYCRGGGKEVNRDVRRMVSDDLQNWTEPEPLIYTGCTDPMEMYTSGIIPYERAKHLYIGTPARYMDHKEWTKNYDRLCGKELRQWRIPLGARYGLATTDGLLMTSRDGLTFQRFGEAFLRPGPESRTNWTYGNGYASHNFAMTPGAYPDEDPELSLYVSRNHWTGEPVEVFRYALRTDGFVSRRGDFAGKTLVTKPFTFDGDTLTINFSTSGIGYLTIRIENEAGEAIEGFDSGVLFGDRIDRIVDFDGDLKTLIGKPIRLRVFLKDADLYAFRFCQRDGIDET